MGKNKTIKERLAVLEFQVKALLTICSAQFGMDVIIPAAWPPVLNFFQFLL